MPNPSPTTRSLALTLLLLSALWTRGQSRWHTGFGLTTATLNFQQNGAGGFAIPLRYDLFTSSNASFSFGTNLKIGTEDQYGLGFPLILGFLLLSGQSGSAPDLSGININDSSRGTIVCFFSEVPLLLHYNWGLGSNNGSDKRFGFYLGGGMSQTITGYTNKAGNEHSTSFLGWVVNAGVRFARNKDLGFSMTRPMENPIGPIRNPILYQLTLTAFPR
jgi:hypothetical protein